MLGLGPLALFCRGGAGSLWSDPRDRALAASHLSIHLSSRAAPGRTSPPAVGIQLSPYILPVMWAAQAFRGRGALAGVQPCVRRASGMLLGAAKVARREDIQGICGTREAGPT